MEALYENPYTVDAGHFQLETYPFGYRYHKVDEAGDTLVSKGWTIAPMNLRLGILNNLDAQLALAPYTVAMTRDKFGSERRAGFGDLISRLRLNLWGNDEGKTAAAVTPFLKIPTNQDGLGNDSFEGGLIFAWSAELPLGWWFIVTPELDLSANLNSAGYHAEGAGTAYFWHSITKELSGYVEFASRASAESKVPWIGTVDLGLTYMLTQNLQLDAGIRLGVTKAADDFNPFLGVSIRF
jgi:hypothetical protein